MEWYDFFIYSYLATYIASAFFPSDNKFLSLMGAFAALALGYIMRPIGAILFGHIGDRHGQMKGVYIATVMITLPTVMIGLLPTYQSIGVFAPVILLLLRALQGLSVGGQCAGSKAVLRNMVPYSFAARSMFVASFAGSLGVLLASLIAWIAALLFSGTLAWRTPFLFAGAFLPFLILMHQESKKNIISHEKLKFPLLQLLKQNKKEIIKLMPLFICGSFYYSCVYIYLISYMKIDLKVPISKVLLMYSIVHLFIMIGEYVAAYLTDTFGRRNIMFYGSILLAAAVIPGFYLIQMPQLSMVFLGLLILTFAYAICVEPHSVIAVEAFE